MFVDLMSLSEAGRRLGVSYKTIGEVARKKGVPVVDHPSNGAAKAIDREGFKVIEEALRPAYAAPA